MDRRDDASCINNAKFIHNINKESVSLELIVGIKLKTDSKKREIKLCSKRLAAKPARRFGVGPAPRVKATPFGHSHFDLRVCADTVSDRND